MPFAGDLRLRLGPVDVCSSVKFSDHRMFSACATFSGGDETKLLDLFMHYAVAVDGREEESEGFINMHIGNGDANKTSGLAIRSEELPLIMSEFGIDVDGHASVLESFIVPFLKALPDIHSSGPIEMKGSDSCNYDASEPELENDQQQSEPEKAESKSLQDEEDRAEDKVEGKAESKVEDECEDETKSIQENKQGGQEKPAVISRRLDNIGVSRNVNFAALCTLMAELYAPYYIYGKELNRAAGRGDVDGIRELVARGCLPDPCARGKRFACTTPLHCACETGDEEAVALLIELVGNNRLDTMDANGWTPLISAAAHNQPKIVVLLLKNKADFALTTMTGRNAMHWAAAKGHSEVVKAIISEGCAALVKSQDFEGFTPLHYAVLNGAEDLAALLLKFGAIKDEVCSTGRTARDMCTDPEMTERLFGPLPLSNKRNCKK